MEEQNNQPEETPKKTNDIEDIEMGTEKPETEEHPKVNNYMNDIKQAEESKDSPEASVDPTAAAPKTEEPKDKQLRPQIDTQAYHGRPMANGEKPGKKKGNPAARRKALIGILGAFGGLVLIAFVIALVFISKSGEAESPIAGLLGMSHASFINGLITFVHLVFVAVALALFVFTMMGLFKSMLARKDDKVTKKKGVKMSIIFAIALLVLLIVWMFSYVYLNEKRVIDTSKLPPAITTQPEDLLNLTAPINIRFNGSNVPFDSDKFRILSYRWDFGDGETGTNQIVTHTYSDKGEDEDGRFNVVLTVTRQDKKTGDEFEDVHTLIVTIANQALSAIIKADPQDGEAPLMVEFDGSDSVDPDGEIESYEWDLDDDGEFDDAEGRRTEHEFEKTGKYTVSLRVTSISGEFDVVEKEIIVGEKEIPIAIITVTDEPENFETNVQYIFKADDSTSPNGKIDSYEWDFGDGSKVEKTKTVAHTFDTAGKYEIKLLVTDEKDKDGELSMEITVGAPQGVPVAVITTEPTAEGITLKGPVPFNVTFSAAESSDSDENIIDYEWDFQSDGVVDKYGEVTSYTFTQQGTYTVTLLVMDSDNNIGEDTIVVSVEAQGIVADIQTNRIEGNVPLTIDFDASGSTYDQGQITSYQWEFGDGTKPKLGAAQISHKYTEIGTYTASVTIIGSDGSVGTAELLITVREIPLSACFVSVFEEGEAPLETAFDPGCSTGTASSYFWDFGDGSTSTLVKPSHIFENAGEFTVNLEITDSENTVSQAEVLINVTE